jgi:ubiquinone/menaquinone biosynthesis C-methylase UbiE
MKEYFLRITSPLMVLDQKLDFQTKLLITESVKPNTNWLDLGCGLKPYAPLFAGTSYIGIDIQVSGRPGILKDADIYFDGTNIPFGDSTFEGILCTQVMEHVSNIEFLVSECNRVLKKNGVILLTVPFIQREHEQPFDFRRFTSFGLIQTFENHGFKIEKIDKCLGYIETIAMLANSYVSKHLSSKSKIRFVLGSIFVCFNTALGKTLTRILPDNGEVYSVLVLKASKL